MTYVVLWAACLTAPPNTSPANDHSSALRPNILWISCEDMSPDLGCYGDAYARTPHLDRLARESVRFTHVFTHAGVCAPSRSGLITGMYPTSIGTHSMRCQGVPPPDVKCFTEYLRAAGYYCTNNVKTDYQFPPPVTAWDENSSRADWRGRQEGQPFFAVINLTTTHESQIRQSPRSWTRLRRQLAPELLHDPEKAMLPPYYPDTPVVRQDWANYYDLISAMDQQVADILKRLETDGLADDTIVWFWSDHGRGLPRAKRWLYDSGTRVPLLLRVPPKFRSWARPDRPDALNPGNVNDELIAFVDFAPTMLRLAGLTPPPSMQGQAFLGPNRPAPRQFVYGARDRMDETVDLIRSVRDRRFRYVYNFLPHLSYGQDIAYMNEMPTMQEMRRLHREGKLQGPQKTYFLPTKPIEEAYDTAADPHEIENLAGRPEHEAVLVRLRTELFRWMRSIRDVGLMPEPEFDALKRPGDRWLTTPAPELTVARNDDGTRRVTLAAIRGASLAYRWDHDPPDRWRLYHGPVTLVNGAVLSAKACRLGYRDSRVIRTDQPSAPHESFDEPHWYDHLDADGGLSRLYDLKLRAPNELTIERTWGALRDRNPSVRTWGVIGLQHRALAEVEREKARLEFARLLGDPSPSVRLAAASALAAWGEAAKALPIVAAAFDHELGSVRVTALAAVPHFGPAAAALRPRLEAIAKDGSEYEKRLSQSALRSLANPTGR